MSRKPARKSGAAAAGFAESLPTALSAKIPEAVVVESQRMPIEVARSPTNNGTGYNASELSLLKSFPFPEPNKEGVKRFLTQSNWPPGLQEALIKSITKIPIRFFIVDDSGSMLSNDGKRRIGEGPTSKIINCTRWSELSSSMEFHIQLASSANAVTEFRFLNQKNPIIIGRPDGEDTRKELLSDLFEAGPAGQTPLCYHVRAIIGKYTYIH